MKDDNSTTICLAALCRSAPAVRVSTRLRSLRPRDHFKLFRHVNFIVSVAKTSKIHELIQSWEGARDRCALPDHPAGHTI
jgi:hypothetical protein